MGFHFDSTMSFLLFYKGQWQLMETKLGQLFKGDNSSRPSNEKCFLSIPTAPTLLEGPKCLSINGFSDKQETEKTMEERYFLYTYARSPDASVSELLSTNLGIDLTTWELTQARNVYSSRYLPVSRIRGCQKQRHQQVHAVCLVSFNSFVCSHNKHVIYLVVSTYQSKDAFTLIL